MTSRAKKSSSASKPPEFRGSVVRPGNKISLHDGATWLDGVLGPTLSPLVELLRFQKMKQQECQNVRPFNMKLPGMLVGCSN